MHRFADTSFRFLRIASAIGMGACCLAIDAWAHGGLHERIETLSEKIATTPGRPELHFELASVYCQHEEWKEALVEIEKTDELAPGKFPTFFLRGQVAAGLGRLEQAWALFDSFLKQSPGHSGARLHRARLLMKLGRFEESLTDYREALRTNGNPDADFVGEGVDALIKHGAKEEALRILDEAMIKLGPVPSLQTRALELDVAAGRFDSALERVDILQKNAVRPETWMARRASILQRAGKNNEARAEWEALIARLEKLPNLKRGAEPIRRLEAEAREALSALKTLPNPGATSAANTR